MVTRPLGHPLKLRSVAGTLRMPCAQLEAKPADRSKPAFW